MVTEVSPDLIIRNVERVTWSHAPSPIHLPNVVHIISNIETLGGNKLESELYYAERISIERSSNPRVVVGNNRNTVHFMDRGTCKLIWNERGELAKNATLIRCEANENNIR